MAWPWLRINLVDMATSRAVTQFSYSVPAPSKATGTTSFPKYTLMGFTLLTIITFPRVLGIV